jgi:hypothetical protein
MLGHGTPVALRPQNTNNVLGAAGRANPVHLPIGRHRVIFSVRVLHEGSERSLHVGRFKDLPKIL